MSNNWHLSGSPYGPTLFFLNQERSIFRLLSPKHSFLFWKKLGIRAPWEGCRPQQASSWCVETDSRQPLLHSVPGNEPPPKWNRYIPLFYFSCCYIVLLFFAELPFANPKVFSEGLRKAQQIDRKEVTVPYKYPESMFFKSLGSPQSPSLVLFFQPVINSVWQPLPSKHRVWVPVRQWRRCWPQREEGHRPRSLTFICGWVPC